jgi:hypothetical protein
MISTPQTFRELIRAMRPQDPHGDGTGLRFETGEHGGDYPDSMPQAVTVTDAEGRWAVYVPLRIDGTIVIPEQPPYSG